MSLGLIIYLASIAGTVSSMLAVFAFFSGVIAAMSAVGYMEKKKEGAEASKGLLITFLLLLVFFSVTASVIPPEEAIYKMAGVTEQQKAKINATGAVVESEHQAEAQ